MFKDTHAFSGFSVDDLQKARQFYREILGLTVRNGAPGTMSLEIAGGTHIFVYEKPDHIPATYTNLTFPVPDVEAALDALVAKGVKFQKYEGMEQTPKGIFTQAGPQIAWFTDPAGNTFAIVADEKNPAKNAGGVPWLA